MSKEITWVDIQDANSEIKTTNIKGKEYAEVPQRIQAFRKVYPTGYIVSRIEAMKDGVVVMSAECGSYDADGTRHLIGTGTAYEKESSTFINKTSYIENCETSAVGRALGMAGFGVDGSVASALEVMNAINNQGEAPKGRRPASSQGAARKAQQDRQESRSDIETEADLNKPMTAGQKAKIVAEAKRTGYDISVFEQAKKKELGKFTRLDADSIIRQLAGRKTKKREPEPIPVEDIVDDAELPCGNMEQVNFADL